VRILDPAAGALALDRTLTALILPPSLGQDLPDDPGGSLRSWILDRHREGTLLCSVCAGGFLLAETGLLAGRPATTHWAAKARFAARYPEVLLDTDRILIDDGDIITAGGLMAWIDLGLLLVGRFLGPTAVLSTARLFLVDPSGREQRFYSTFAPVLDHGDQAILRTQRWLHHHSAERVDIARMAAVAHLGERTFLRRFQRAAGLRPTEYLQYLRVGHARDLLERSDLAVDEIAWRVGYQDPGAFRKILQRLTGLSPGEYRRRFAYPPPASGGSG
jgi:transcriptional regulator GlxA family with amidase domain